MSFFSGLTLLLIYLCSRGVDYLQIGQYAFELRAWHVAVSAAAAIFCGYLKVEVFGEIETALRSLEHTLKEKKV